MPYFAGSHQPWITATIANKALTKPIDQARPAVAEISVTRPVMMKSFRTRRHFGVFSSKWPNRMLPTANIVVMAAMSIQRFMIGPRSAGESLPQKIGVQHRDDHRDRPRERLHPPRADERSHLVPVAREHHQRKHGKREL